MTSKDGRVAELFKAPVLKDDGLYIDQYPIVVLYSNLFDIR